MFLRTRPTTEVVIALANIICRSRIGINQIVKVCARFKCHIFFLLASYGEPVVVIIRSKLPECLSRLSAF